jgi:glutathione synthase
MADEAISREHQIFECDQDMVSLLDGEIICVAEQYFGAHKQNSNVQKFTIKSDFDIVFWRQNPPVDMAYLTTLYLLQIIENDVLILNKPSSVIRFAEKILPHYFAEFSPPTLISKNRDEILDFIKAHNGAVAKPLYFFGGNGVEKLGADDLAKLDELLAASNEPLVYQKFLPEVVEGDKRFVFVNGKFVKAFNRVPPEGEFIANLCHGGSAKPFEPNEYHKTQIIPKVEQFLSDNDISFCGIDVIGNYVNEMNITSPLTFPPLFDVYGINAATNFWSEIEAKLTN